MNKEIKISSDQGGNFTVTQNRLSYTVPDDGVYDMSRSYINLNAVINVTENEVATGTGVYIMDLKWKSQTANNPKFFNSSIVKNASIRSSRNGQIENIRRVDLLTNILKTYNTSTQENKCLSYKAGSQLVDAVDKQQYSIYRDINKLGNVKSKANNNTPVKIPLSDLFDFCAQATELDTQKTGRVRIDCELNIDKLEPQQKMLINEWPAEANLLNDLTTVGGQNTIVTQCAFTEMHQSPYYVSQKLQLTATGNGGAPNLAAEVLTIQSISKNDNGTLTITTEQNFANLAVGQTYTAVSILAVEAVASSTVSVDFAELVLVKLNKSSSDFDEIQYGTFSTDQSNGNSLNNYQRQFQVEAESDCVVIVQPDSNNDLLSKSGIVDNYRLRLNNNDITDRSVFQDSPLYYDSISSTMTKMKLRLKSLFENNGNTSKKTYNPYEATSQQESIMSTLEQTVNEKLLQVNINCKLGESVNELVMFKHLPRVFSY